MELATILKVEDTKPKERGLSLFDHSLRLHQAVEFLENDEETTQEELELVDWVGQEFELKAARVGYTAKRYAEAEKLLVAEAKELEAQAKDIKERAAIFGRVAERMRNNIAAGMAFNEVGKIVAIGVTLTVCKKPETLVGDDLDSLPEDYIRRTAEPRKMEIKRALKDGQHIKGWKLESGGTTLRIK